MLDNYIELSLEEFLEKIGAGKPVPGSGSAAALEGMISAKMTLTVAKITRKKDEFKDHWSKCDEIITEIDEIIYPWLAYHFQADSYFFSKHMELRKIRMKKLILNGEADYEPQELETLKLASDQTAQIAEICLKLTIFSNFLLCNGYLDVRGDSSVAINSAFSGLKSCLSIIELNLLYFDHLDDWVSEMTLKRKRFYFFINKWNTLVTNSQDLLKTEVDDKFFQLEMNRYNSFPLENPNLNSSNIEELARNFQNKLWQQHIYNAEVGKRLDLWTILQPEFALEMLGYNFIREETLGEHQIGSERFEVAGLINKKEKVVAISEQFSPNIQNFTLAHELGHAILHNQNVLHRDRPLNGDSNIDRSWEEKQADKFASCYLMPRSWMLADFKKLFGVNKFILDEESAFALNEHSVMDVKKRFKNRRGLSTHLAGLEFYKGNAFLSLSKHFKVSIQAMAIRLENLNLVEDF